MFRFISSLKLSWRQSSGWWLAVSILVLLLIIIPLVYVLLHFFSTPETKILSHTVQSDAIKNSVLLSFGVGILALLFGISTAWVVSVYRFPLSRFFSWALILPLTIPGYIMAFTYSGIFNYAGPVQTYLRENFGRETAKSFYFDILTFPVLILLLSLVLFPYVFIAARTAFSRNSSNYIEAARSLGATQRSVFFRIALPLARPAIAAGLFLVIMETLNDYGAASFFGIRTFTTSIFSTWSFDLSSALKLASWLLLFILILYLGEQFLRGKSRFIQHPKSRPISKIKLNGWKSVVAFLICFLPFFFGFIFPVYFLCNWMFADTTLISENFPGLIWNSFLLAFIAAFVICIIGILLAYTRFLHPNLFGKQLSAFASIGYAVPGAVIAVGVLVISGWCDSFISNNITGEKGLFLTGSIFILIYAYSVRFLAVAYQPLDAALRKNAISINESARTLGATPMRTLLKINFPVLKPALLAAMILVFVDVLKELPLTLILRPFDFETLATETYRYAKIMESVPDSSAPALIIIFIGAIPVFLLHRLANTKNAL